MTAQDKVKSDKFQLVTDKIASLLEQGVKPWAKPWACPNSAKFQNLISKDPYKGLNPMLCAVDCLFYGYTHPYFVGFHQAKDRGWKIKKGAKSTWIRWGGSYAIENEDGDKEYRGAFKWLNVFNIDHVDDSESDLKVADFLPVDDDGDRPNPDPIPALDAIVSHSGAVVKHGHDSAFYSPKGDFIGMPELKYFSDSMGYYATLIHELTHWTGHKSRLNRPQVGQFGSKDYAYEELIAELGAAMVLGSLGLESETIDSHASYIDFWLTSLKNDKKFFFKAAGEAMKASELLLAKPE